MLCFICDTPLIRKIINLERNYPACYPIPRGEHVVLSRDNPSTESITCKGVISIKRGEAAASKTDDKRYGIGDKEAEKREKKVT